MYIGSIYYEQFLAKYDKKKADEKLKAEGKNINTNKKSAFSFFFKSESKAF